jgi:hypothetical protein
MLEIKKRKYAIYAIEYCSVIKKIEIMSFAGKILELDKYHMLFFHMWNLDQKPSTMKIKWELFAEPVAGGRVKGEGDGGQYD